MLSLHLALLMFFIWNDYMKKNWLCRSAHPPAEESSKPTQYLSLAPTNGNNSRDKRLCACLEQFKIIVLLLIIDIYA